jgi:hypothetical protein
VERGDVTTKNKDIAVNGHEADDATGATGATGESSPRYADIWPPPNAPLRVAWRFYQETGFTNGIRNLLFWCGTWTMWAGTHWREIDEELVINRLYRALAHAVYVNNEDREEDSSLFGAFFDLLGQANPVPWNPDPAKINRVLNVMRSAVGLLESHTDPPVWVHVADPDVPATQMISFENGLFDLGTRTMHDHTPALFNLPCATSSTMCRAHSAAKAKSLRQHRCVVEPHHHT